jgi:hypothetical protein
LRIHEANPIRNIVFCALVSSSLLAPAASAQESLRWKLSKGDQMKYSRKHERAMRGTVGDQPLNQSAERVTDVTLVVDTVAGDGSVRITETIDRIRFSQTMPSGNVEFDSASEPTGDGGKLAASLRLLVGLDFSFRMTPRGEVANLELSDASKKRLAENPDVLPAGKETDFLRQIVPSMQLPEEESVAVGTTWQEVIELSEPRVGTRKVMWTYEYTGSHAAGDAWLADVKIRGSAKLEPASDAAAKIEVLNESITGTAHFDSRGGFLVERTETETTKTRITVNEQSFEQEAENLITVRRVQNGTSSSAHESHP